MTAFISSTGFFWTVLVLGLYLAWWRKMAHDMGATILKDPKHTPRFVLPFLMPLVLVMFKPGWFGFLAIMSIPLLIHARGKVRYLLLATWGMALILVFPSWPMLRSAVPTIDPASEVTLLDRSCSLPPSGSLIKELKNRLAKAEDTPRINRLTVALAIQEARRGQYQESTRLFKKVLEKEPDNFPAMVGVANNTYYRGHMDSAAKAYSNIALTHPRRGEAPYNLAQVYFKKLFVPEATEAMDKARSLGFIPSFSTKGRSRQNGYAPVVYPPLTLIKEIGPHSIAAFAKIKVPSTGSCSEIVAPHPNDSSSQEKSKKREPPRCQVLIPTQRLSPTVRITKTTAASATRRLR